MRSSSASAFPRSCGVISAIEHPGLEAAGGALKDPGGVLDGPGALIRGWRHAGRIEPFAPAAPDLNCLDIDVSHRAARPGPGAGYGEPPPATLTENESVARPAPPRHSSKP